MPIRPGHHPLDHLNAEDRKCTISVFNGPVPEIVVLDDAATEIQAVGRWLAARTGEGLLPQEIGVFVRSAAELNRARAAVGAAGLPFKVLDDNVETADGFPSVLCILPKDSNSGRLW